MPRVTNFQLFISLASENSDISKSQEFYLVVPSRHINMFQVDMVLHFLHQSLFIKQHPAILRPMMKLWYFYIHFYIRQILIFVEKSEHMETLNVIICSLSIQVAAGGFKSMNKLPFCQTSIADSAVIFKLIYMVYWICFCYATYVY